MDDKREALFKSSRLLDFRFLSFLSTAPPRIREFDMSFPLFRGFSRSLIKESDGVPSLLLFPLSSAMISLKAAWIASILLASSPLSHSLESSGSSPKSLSLPCDSPFSSLPIRKLSWLECFAEGGGGETSFGERIRGADAYDGESEGEGECSWASIPFALPFRRSAESFELLFRESLESPTLTLLAKDGGKSALINSLTEMEGPPGVVGAVIIVGGREWLFRWIEPGSGEKDGEETGVGECGLGKLITLGVCGVIWCRGR